MKPVLLIAGNFLREQRWVVLVLLLWVLLNASVFQLAGDLSSEGLLAFAKVHAAYGVALGVFLAGPALHNDRRSRRVLSVLSKAVGRGEYLAGLLLGTTAVVGSYLAGIALAGVLLFPAAYGLTELLGMLLQAAIAALLAATVSVLFAIVIPPLFATAAAVLLLLVPAALAQITGMPAWLNILPVYVLVLNLMEAGTETSWQPAWQAIWLALPQIAIVWLLAARLFAARDIAVAVE